LDQRRRLFSEFVSKTMQWHGRLFCRTGSADESGVWSPIGESVKPGTFQSDSAGSPEKIPAGSPQNRHGRCHPLDACAPVADRVHTFSPRLIAFIRP
jgi:hypothetical protein